MSNFPSIFVSLICFISLTTTTVVAGRHISVINKEVPQNLTKSLETPRSKQVNDTWSNEGKKKVKVEQKKRQVSKNNDNNDAQDFEVMNEDERQEDLVERLSNYSKHIKTKFPKTKVITWRVPKEKKRVKNIGFNLDYAPPKLHPPSHN